MMENQKTLLRALMLALLGILFLACSEPPERIHRKLETVLQADLKYTVGEVMKKSGKTYLLDQPYYVIKELRFFEGDTARKYSAYAEVDFYYFKDIGMYQKRKYRYDTYRYWDRYYKKMMHAPKSP